ncbi:MAG: hypothetical protein EHM72_11305 [Calditrichaeota bacterium]|nr:MAG: hypothetical protein EHM72_11305 [Calditrichota bacterium]
MTLKTARCAAQSFPGFLMMILLLLPSFAFPQTAAHTAPTPSDIINIYIDSPDWYMDLDYYRTEIPYVNYMRDRADADVHILTTTQRTGGGGIEFTINFIGLRKFHGQQNALKYISRQTDTEDIIRKQLARYFKIGLMPFVAQTPAIEQIDIHYQKEESDAASSKVVDDPWNYWTFSTRLRGYFNGEKSYKYNNLNSSISANRVTEAWKTNFYLSISNTRTIYDYGDELSYTDDRRSNYLNASVVKSLTPRWSMAVRLGASKSTYNNFDLSTYFLPGIEFNVYPYSEATRHQFTFQYLIGAHYYDYHEMTIYYKMTEQRLSENVNIAYEIKQPWGSVSSSLEGSHYFYDIKKFNISLNNSIELKLVKGLSLELYGYITFLRDQISLPSSGASLEEILLRRRELETSYYYYLSIGLSYTFGSIYNNVVNPRF